MDPERAVTIIGGGLAGSEAAWQLARRGIAVTMREMRPDVPTPAHQTGDFAELVCSNSLKSEAPGSAPFLLKQELRRLGSLLLEVAEGCRVPAGQALAVDRIAFARGITTALWPSRGSGSSGRGGDHPAGAAADPGHRPADRRRPGRRYRGA